MRPGLDSPYRYHPPVQVASRHAPNPPCVRAVWGDVGGHRHTAKRRRISGQVGRPAVERAGVDHPEGRIDTRAMTQVRVREDGVGMVSVPFRSDGDGTRDVPGASSPSAALSPKRRTISCPIIAEDPVRPEVGVNRVCVPVAEPTSL